MGLTLIIIIITSVFSIIAFSRPGLMHKYQFNPYQIYHLKQWYRLITHAFLHADWTHLIINMLVLFSFGSALEYYFEYFFGAKKILYFLILYFGSIVISTLYASMKHKDNYRYNAVGASGAVSAVVFACIFFAPLEKVYLFGVVGIPGIVFAVLYLIYSYYMSKKARQGGQEADNVAHDAHFWGAVFGFVFPLFLDAGLFSVFINQLMNF